MSQEKDKGGRPAIVVDDELLEKAREYLLHGYTAEEVCPTVCGLACYLGISKKSVYNIATRSDQFLHALDAIQAKQETLLIKNGLSGDFNSTIAKLMLSNHGHSDKVGIDHQSTDGSMSPQKMTDAELLAARQQLEKIYRDEPDQQ